jgi:hypothetical protein
VTGRRALLALSYAVSVLAVGFIAQLGVGVRAIHACDAAREQGDVPAALAAARRAAEAIAPGSPYPEAGYARLTSIARAAESQADLSTALAAWRAVRAAGLATRTLGLSPHVAEANEALLRLGTHPRPEALRDNETEPVIVKPILVETLARDSMPATWVLVLLAVGAVAFLGGAARLASLPPGAPRRDAGLPAVATLIGLTLYALVCLRG